MTILYVACYRVCLRGGPGYGVCSIGNGGQIREYDCSPGLDRPVCWQNGKFACVHNHECLLSPERVTNTLPYVDCINKPLLLKYG